jgi:hypothetical protein
MHQQKLWNTIISISIEERQKHQIKAMEEFAKSLGIRFGNGKV